MIPETRGDGSAWPTISIVTPSFNQAQYIEETIRSVLLQGYPSLEYIVMDGGSTDGSREILERYGPFLDYLTSTKDEGQADALNKGFARATGDVFGFINSDDVLAKGAIGRLATETHRCENGSRVWLCFPVEDFDESGPRATALQRASCDLAEWVRLSSSLHQPGVFWSADMFRECGGFDARLQCAFDRDLFMRFLVRGWRFRVVRGPAIARFRLHERSKTVVDGEADLRDSRFQREFETISRRMFCLLPAAERQACADVLRRRDLVRAGLIDGVYEPPRGLGLFRAAMAYPGVVRSRVFWGAIRRWASKRLTAGLSARARRPGS